MPTIVAASAPALTPSAISLTEPSATQVVLTISAAVLSGLVALALSTWHMRRFEARKVKFDTLKKFAANRYDLKGDEFTQAINEIFIVFNGSPKVMTSLSAFHRTTVRESATNDELAALFKAMCVDLGVDYSQFNESYFLQPFNAHKSSTSAPSQEIPPK